MDAIAGMPGGNPETRKRLIDAAVKHFADHGFASASQRAIQREAGVNSAATHYYFGSKVSMFRAVIDTFVHDVQSERGRRLDAVPADLAGAALLHRLLSDYYAPGFAVATTPSGFHYTRILARSQGDPDSDTRRTFNEIVGPMRERYVDRICAGFPSLARSDAYDLLTAGVTLMAVFAVGPRYERLLEDGGPDREAERVATIIAGGYGALLGIDWH